MNRSAPKKSVQKTPKRSISTTTKQKKLKSTRKNSTKKSSSLTTTSKRSYNATEAFEQPTIHSEPNQPAQFGQSGHTLRVKKLYRKALREHFNWYGLQYDNWVNKTEELREQFELYRNLTDAGEIETVIKEAEVYLFKTEDPSPYRPLMHPQGGLWGRNEAPSRELLKPPPSQFVVGRDYHEEERVIRHLHASPDDPDYTPNVSAYAKKKVLDGEYWFDPVDPASYNETVVQYCATVGIPFTPVFEDIVETNDNKKHAKVTSSHDV